MVGIGLRKYAREKGLRISNGVIYGDLGGYAVTFSEGMGTKMMWITAWQRNEGDAERLDEMLEEIDLNKNYRITGKLVASGLLVFCFYDNPGTMGKLKRFVDWIIPYLSDFGMVGTSHCSGCGLPIDGNCSWKLLNKVAYRQHDACFVSIMQEVNEILDKEEDIGGSYSKGILGSIIGALIGAALWAISYNFVFASPAIGIVIWMLALKGYDHFGGRPGWLKFPVLILVSLAGSLIGNFGSYAITVVLMLRDGELYNYMYTDTARLIFEAMENDTAFLRDFVAEAGKGSLYAGAMSVLYIIDSIIDRKSQKLKLTDLEEQKK
jgi:hypothetical protein